MEMLTSFLTRQGTSRALLRSWALGSNPSRCHHLGGAPAPIVEPASLLFAACLALGHIGEFGELVSHSSHSIDQDLVLQPKIEQSLAVPIGTDVSECHKVLGDPAVIDFDDDLFLGEQALPERMPSASILGCGSGLGGVGIPFRCNLPSKKDVRDD